MENTDSLILNPVKQVQKAERTSDYYQFIPTVKVTELLTKLGWQKTEELITKTRTKGNQGFQKHMIRFKNDGMTWDNENRPELVVVNAHNGLSSLKFMFGIFRMICSNGIIAMDKGETFRVIHKGDVETKLKSAVESILALSQRRRQQMLAMQQFDLNTEDIKTFARRAALLIMPEHALTTDQTVMGLTQTHRPEDNTTNLWNVFNVVQENITQHGFKYITRKPSQLTPGEVLTTTHRTRRINSVARTANVNVKLWRLAQEFGAAA